MLNLLIADDEKIIRESLATCLDWAQVGIKVVGCCANGAEALDAVIDNPPDIVMTDIKMPGLNGLELVEKIQQIDKDIEFIILSGYREFDFAQQAVKLGVRRYLLKPASEEQILESVMDAIQSCEKARALKMTMEAHKRLQMQVGQYLPDAVDEDQNPNYLVQTVKQHIAANLADSALSLKKIADEYVHVNPDYLSRLFVQKTGEKFSHYLNRKRVETAKRLLQADGKVCDVAERVGLGHNPRYFGQVFKKYTGITPSAYAEQYCKSDAHL